MVKPLSMAFLATFSTRSGSFRERSLSCAEDGSCLNAAVGCGSCRLIMATPTALFSQVLESGKCGVRICRQEREKMRS